MKKLLLLSLALLGILCFVVESNAACPGGICEPLTCNQAGVEAYVAMNAVNGDKVQLPACAPTNWGGSGNGFDPAVGVMLQGEPCTVGDSGKDDALGRNIEIALSCPTNIVDAGDTFGIPLFNIPVPACAHPCSYQVGLRHLALTSTGTRPGSDFWSTFFPPCCVQSFEDGRRVKLEYLNIEGIGNNNGFLFVTSEWGVAAHIYWRPPVDKGGYVLQHETVGTGISSTRSDERTASTSLFGREDAFTVESSVFIARWSSTVFEARLVDAASAGGARVALRNNYVEGFHVDSHGIESGIRGPHYYEWYGNCFVAPNPSGSYPTMGHIRSGGVLVHGNKQCGAGFTAGTPIARLVDYRDGQWGKGYEETSGHSNIDEGDPSNPLVTCTTSAFTEFSTYYTVTCAGVSWAPDQWAGYFVHQPSPSCLPRWDISCSITINSNTSNTLRFRPNLYDGVGTGPYAAARTLMLSPTGGDTIHIDAVVSSFDSPCRTGAASFSATTLATNLTYNSGTGKATLTSPTSMAALGIANDDYVFVDSDWQDTTDPASCGVSTTYCGTPYRGVFQVSEVSGSTFKFTPYRVPSGNATGSWIEFKKRLSGASAQISRCYEFQNFDSSNNAIHFSTAISSGEGSLYQNLRISDGIVANPVVFNWVGTSTTVGVQTSATSPFNGTYGVGVGTLANRPLTCTTGVLYRTTNAGEWDSTNGATADGRNDLCTATDVWTDNALPHLAFPHPLVSNVGGVSTVTPAACVQGQTLNNAALAGLGFQGAGAAFVISGADVTLSDPQVTSDTAATIDIACGASAATGARSLYLTTTAGTGYGGTFTVNGSADTTAPTPGGGGTITPTVLSSNSVSLGWTKATDAVTAQALLQYEVRRSLANNMGSVANAEANGAICQNYTADIATATCSGLDPATLYYFQIIVKDLAGNKQIYTATSATTDAEPGSPPVVGGSGVLQTLSITSDSLILLWFAATDDDTPQNLLQYSIRRSLSANIDTVANAEANGTLVLDYTVIPPGEGGAIAIPIGGLPQSTLFYWNVIVRDGELEKTAYTMTSATTAAVASGDQTSRGRLRN